MCLIAVKEANKEFPKDEYLVEANIRNPDGIGIAYWKEGRNEVYIKKDFKTINVFLEWSKENIKLEDICVIHFRYATHGLTDEGNRHPFPITKNKELLRKVEQVCTIAVAHNGVLRNYGQHKKFSDTQKFVMDILAEDSVKNNLHDKTIRKLVNNFIDGDKLAILDSEGTVFYFGDYNEFEGIQYSNFSYKKVEVPLYKWTPPWQNAGYLTSDKQKKNTNITHSIDVCDGCGDRKLIMDVTYNNTLYMLCKSCRKQVKKGKLILPSYYTGGGVEEAIADDNIPTECCCEGCHRLVKVVDQELYDGMYLCKECISLFKGLEN